MAEPGGELTGARQRLPHHRRHPDPGSYPRRRHADKRLVEQPPDQTLEGCQRKQRRRRCGDRAGVYRLVDRVVHRLVVGHALLARGLVGWSQRLDRSRQAHAETAAGDYPGGAGWSAHYPAGDPAAHHHRRGAKAITQLVEPGALRGLRRGLGVGGEGLPAEGAGVVAQRIPEAGGEPAEEPLSGVGQRRRRAVDQGRHRHTAHRIGKGRRFRCRCRGRRRHRGRHRRPEDVAQALGSGSAGSRGVDRR